MLEILGQLEEYFNNTEPHFECDFATCKYKTNEYEIWSISKSVFDELNSYKKEDWSEYFPNSWWIQVDKYIAKVRAAGIDETISRLKQITYKDVVIIEKANLDDIARELKEKKNE